MEDKEKKGKLFKGSGKELLKDVKDTGLCAIAAVGVVAGGVVGLTKVQEMAQEKVVSTDEAQKTPETLEMLKEWEEWREKHQKKLRGKEFNEVEAISQFLAERETRTGGAGTELRVGDPEWLKNDSKQFEKFREISFAEQKRKEDEMEKFWIKQGIYRGPEK